MNTRSNSSNSILSYNPNDNTSHILLSDRFTEELRRVRQLNIARRIRQIRRTRSQEYSDIILLEDTGDDPARRDIRSPFTVR